MKILIAGDFVPRNRVSQLIENNDYGCLDSIKDYIQRVDYAIVNFESPVVAHVAKPIEKVGPNLSSTDNAMECVARAGFKCVTLANNHFRDYGQIGVRDTLDSCRIYGMDYVGGGLDITEAKKVLYKEIGGEKVAIVNMCEAEWSIATKDYGGSFPINPPVNFRQIKEAHNNADYVIVIVHGGVELYQYPTPRMVELYRFFIEAGADAVVSHHQHCFNGYEVYEGKPIFYGLGNFCFDVNKPSDRLRTQGYMVELLFNRGAVNYEIIPYIQCANYPIVKPMNNEERKAFFEEIDCLNEVIKDTKQLQKKYEILVQSVAKSRLLEFEPFSNKWIRRLQNRGLLPSFISKKTKKDIYCVINCESHRDIILNLFREQLVKEDGN